MNTVAGKNDHDNEIGNEKGQVKTVWGVEPFEGFIQELALKIMDQPLLRIGKEQQRKTATDVQLETPRQLMLKR